AGVKATASCPPSITMDSYPGALSQVLTNLIVNAVVHAYDDGATPGDIAITVAATADRHVRLEVADHGVGMDAEQLGRIFEAFYSTRRDRGGSGLGLHIVETLVAGPLGGRVTVDSQPGRGTRFVVTLPLTAGD
ncbi:HAMP domain-containing histidine kinase, partial [bacterium]|nr:HAMP domain-containing histidine kinase [bacterium]